MLPNHAPLVVAEQFGTLVALHPERIDLGIGRATGTDQPRRTRCGVRRGTLPDDFPQELPRLIGFLDDPYGDAARRIRAVPGRDARPEDLAARLE